MKLQQSLAAAKTEEDVKAAYVKAIGLTSSLGKVDIQADNMWFEAKEAPTPAITMFAQLLWYVRDARIKGEPIPAFLTVIDREKAAILETELAMPALDDAAIEWPKAASAVSKACIAKVAAHIDGHFATYTIANHEKEFLTSIKSALNDGRIIRTMITPDNLRQVFNKWIDMVGKEMVVPNEGDYASLFFADIMHDGYAEAMTGLSARLLQNAGKPVFLMKDGRTFELASLRGYRNFWRIYHRPPETRHRHYLLERRDILLPFDEQKFKGAYYTPLHIVDKAYDLLGQTLGEGWQEEYIVWDMCCGVGNLELSHSNPRNLFMSTLDQEDIDGMKSRGTFAGVEMFQYDYLNDDVTDFGEIDYSLSNKLPTALRTAIADAKAGKAGAKKILVLINPPYGEAANSQGNAGKTGIARKKISFGMDHLGYAARELFVQFMHRIMLEMPDATLAMFSTLKYVNAPNFEEFRERWTAEYRDGFVVHSKAFDSLKGNFPIGFLIWDLGQNAPSGAIHTTVLDKAGNEIGEKNFFNIPNDRFLSGWLGRLKAKSQIIPLKNAISPQDAYAKVSTWHEGAIGYLLSNSNDPQNAGNLTALFSSVYSAGNGYYVTKENLWQAAIVFAVRRLIKPTWLNDRDQFLQPSKPLTEAFKSDCLIWMLFNGSNLSAGADGLRWNDRDWSLVNHFIPFTEAELGVNGRFESDFMARYIAPLSLSPEATAVMDAGRALWRQFHATQFAHKIRDELKLGRADAGWYQVRKALEANSDNEPVNFAPFKAAYTALGDKLRPLVFELGFLPE
jgi:hypothetical protein